MKIKHILIALVFLVNSATAIAGTTNSSSEQKEQARQWVSAQPVHFLENKGQMSDMEGNPIPFVLFKVKSPGVDMYVTKKGLSYLFLKKEEEQEENNDPGSLSFREEEKIKYSRIDMELKGASIKKENILREVPSTTDFNYVYAHCPEGIYGVKQYEKITIRNIYPNIDWVLYNSTGKGFKYDFIVHPGADPNRIKLIYSSLHQLELNRDGGLEIKTTTGSLLEQAPYSYIEETNAEVKTKFQITDQQHIGNEYYQATVTLKLSNFEPSNSQTLVIDPQLVWATLYDLNGGPFSVDCDKTGNVFVTGYTGGTTLPAPNPGGGVYYQGAVVGAFFDFFIYKFTSAGALVWTTYYGGTGTIGEDSQFIHIDRTGNVFITGRTTSSDFPKFNPGGSAYIQPAFGGSWDAYIVKFDNNGVPLWATYYGGSGSDRGYSIATDTLGNVYVTGSTSSSNFPLQTLAGAYNQSTFTGTGNVFILKFTNAGVRLWATYYGSGVGYSLVKDGLENLFVSGTTTSTTFPTLNPGGGAYFQPASGGGQDIFILKFNSTDAIIWSTYYGGISNDAVVSIDADAGNNIFVTGNTLSNNFPTQPATGAYFDATLNGTSDAFILKFNNGGTSLWATYYGGSANENFYSNDNIEIDTCGNVYISFSTFSPDIVTLNPGCGSYYDGTYAGGVGSYGDIFIVKFANSGVSLWATYLGDNNDNFREALAIDASNNLFVTGEWFGPNSFPYTDPGGGAYYNTTIAGSDVGYMTKFIPIPMALTGNSTPTSCSSCNGTATAIPACGTAPYTYLWSNNQTTQSATGLCAGIYTITIADAGCNSRTITVTVTGGGGLTALTSLQTNVLCNGGNNGNVTVTVNGGVNPYTYNWFPSGGANATASNLTAGNYTCIITDSNNCSATQTVTITQPPVLSAAITSTATTCGSANGSASVTANGGTGAITYSWTPTGQITPTATSLSGGITYTALITDSNGCPQTQTVTIAPSTSPSLSLTAQSNVLCNGGNTASATVIALAGTAPYAYSWSTAVVQTSQAATGLANGTYTCTITDANGCTTAQTVTITEPPALAITPSATPTSCNDSTGTATVTPAGGTPNYTYAWNTGQTSLTATGLMKGTYTVIITDANQCTNTASVTVTGMSCPCSDLSLPNAFSPNGDGENDEFCLQGGTEDCIQKLQMTIYDRWGEKVYTSSDKKFCWDAVPAGRQGKYEGNLQNTAVFVYYLDAIMLDGEEIIRKGNISLIK